ncbi:MAG: FG-GAP-like repeat-containing protein [Acidobacteriaceae bacterium]
MHLREWVSSCLVGVSAVFAIAHATAQEVRTPSFDGIHSPSARNPFDTLRRRHAALPSRVSARPAPLRSQPAPADAQTSPAPPFGGFYSGSYFSAAGTDFTAGYFPVAGDFNHDGKTDIVTFAADVICMRPGNGDGTFAAPILTLPNPGQFYYGNLMSVVFAQAADLNGDGYTDLIAGDKFGLVVLLNQKDGTFALSSLLQPPGMPNGQQQFISAIAVGATTASGHPDVVTVWTDAGGNTVAQTFLNDGTGAFPASKRSSYYVSSRVLLPGPTVSLADVNHDGRPDLLIEKQVSSGFAVEIALGNGDGSFAAPQPNALLDFPSASPTYSADLLVTSLTGDPGRQDILVSTSYGPFIASSNGDGTYQTPKPALPNDPIAAPLNGQTGSPQSFMGIQTADLNGDGKPDLILTVGGGLATYLGNGDGTFGPVAGTASLSSNFVAILAPSGNNAATVTQTVFADWNGDGKVDFAFADLYSGYVGVGLGDGKGGFAATPLLYSPGTPHVSPLAFYVGATADLNGDGIADLLGYNSVDGSLVSALAAGKGAFTYKQALAGSVFGMEYVSSTTGDFDGDGKTDFLIGGKDGSLAVALSNGDGTVQTPVPIPLFNGGACLPLYSAVGDLNGDGKLDLVVTYLGDVPCDPSTPTRSGSKPSGYFVALGNGDGTFSNDNVHFYPLGASLQPVALARYHGAQKPLDLIVSDNPQTLGMGGATASVSLLAGNGDGTFASPVTLDSSHAVEQLLTDDYNRDGKPDLTLIADLNFAAATFVEGGVFLLPGNGDGTFGSTVQVPGAPDVYQGAFADLNGDGLDDLILSNNPSYEAGKPGQAFSGVSVLLATAAGIFAPPLNYANGAYPLLLGKFLGDNTISIAGPDNGAAGFLMNAGGTSIMLTPSAIAIAAGQSLTISAAVQATLPGRPLPSGAVTFYDGQTPIGHGTLSNGSSVFSTTALATGTHMLAVSYGGDSSFNPNTSGASSVTVAAPLPPSPDYVFTLDASALTIAKGQSGTLGITIAANSSLSASVSFACSGLPAEATCTVDPASLNLSPGQTGAAAITIATKAASANAMAGLANRSPFLFPAGAAFAGMLCLILPAGVRSRRLWIVIFAAVCLVAGSAVLTGCGGSTARSSGPGSPADPGTPAGSSVVMVTATAISGTATVTHTATVTLAVQ